MDKNKVYLFKPRVNKGGNTMTTIKIKPIKATPAVEGRYAKEIIKEAMRKPSESAVKRNMAASELVRKLRG